MGTLGFAAGHVVLIAGWALVNTGLVGALPPFDPYPFGLLSGLFSLEGVLLASFMLIKQNRLGKRADHRAHLDLQVGLLAEQEITKVIQMVQRLTEQLDVPRERVVDAEAEELGEVTAVGDLAQQLRNRLPESDAPE